MKLIKKILKITLWTLAIVLGLVILLVATLPLWLAPVVKPIVNSTVPKVTQTEFKLGHLWVNPYCGRIEVGDVYLANPTNYSEKCAASLGLFVMDFQPGALAKNVIHLEEITVSNVFVSVAYDKGVLNFKQIQINAAGGEEGYRRKQAEAAAKMELDQQELERIEASKTEEDRIREEAAARREALSKKKLIIDRVTLTGIKISFGYVILPVPTITLTDIGKESGGASFEELWQQILDSVLKSSGAVGDALNGAGKKALDVGRSALDASSKGLDSALDSAKNLNFDGTKDSLKSTGKALEGMGKSLKGLFK